MSDNASESRSATFAQTVAWLGARHPSSTPVLQEQGGVEQVQQTILDEC